MTGGRAMILGVDPAKCPVILATTDWDGNTISQLLSWLNPLLFENDWNKMRIYCVVYTFFAENIVRYSSIKLRLFEVGGVLFCRYYSLFWDDPFTALPFQEKPWPSIVLWRQESCCCFSIIFSIIFFESLRKHCWIIKLAVNRACDRNQ